jgi:hypothetical protein
MIDANALLRRWISQGLATQRVSAVILPDYVPETGDGFQPSDGPWVVVNVRGGTAYDEAPIIKPSMQVRVWAGRDQFMLARAVYLQLFDLLDGEQIDLDVDGRVIACNEETQGMDVVDPDTGFATVIADFSLIACASNNLGGNS